MKIFDGNWGERPPGLATLEVFQQQVNTNDEKGLDRQLSFIYASCLQVVDRKLKLMSLLVKGLALIMMVSLLKRVLVQKQRELRCGKNELFITNEEWNT
jgi:hypothetical protein